jgi:cytochrome P450
MRLSAPSAGDEPDLGAINLMDSRFYAQSEPHALWNYMRRDRPVYRQELPDGSGFWAVTRYGDVRRVLRNYHEFSSRHGTMLSIIDVALPDIASDQMMPDTDPPLHGRIREPVARALAARALHEHQPRIRQIVRALLEPALAGEVIDLAAAALMFPMAFTGSLMGVPEQDWAAMARATTRTIAYDDPDYAAGEPLPTLRLAHHELFASSAAEIERRRGRAEPSQDVIDILLSMTIEGQQLSAEQVLFNCYAVLLGANVTTRTRPPRRSWH